MGTEATSTLITN